ncbi:MAG: zinc ABC transporter substrate-binding protein [Bacillus subtilis]|nr:zinc ABC transporter substrate-binding protein [Bacillus subtilis]
MRKLILLILLFLTPFVLIACSSHPTYDIVTTHYAQYDFVRTIVQDRLSVGMVIRPGVEAHGYEPTTQNILTINDASLFIYTSDLFDPWAKDAVESNNQTTVVLDLSTKIDVDEIEHDHDHVALPLASSPVVLGEDDHEEGVDPHYWVDLIVAMQMVDALVEQINPIFPEFTSEFTANAEVLHEELHELHEELEAYFDAIPTIERVIFHAGHVNLAYFARRYGITVVSLTEQYAPDGDPTSQQIATMIDRIKADGASFLFYEELTTPRVATTIRSELANEGVTITLLLFHGLHNVTLEDYEAGVTYLDLMQANFERLQQQFVGVQ